MILEVGRWQTDRK